MSFYYARIRRGDNMQVDCIKVKQIIEECSSATIIAATKYIDIEQINILEECGITNFGENRVQVLTEKYAQYEGMSKFHMIGTLQTNKVKYIIDKVSMIHSIDSIKLLKEVNKQAMKHKIVMPVLLQVNVAKEESKHGFMIEELENILKEATAFSNVEVQGFMMMAPNHNNVEIYFKQTKELLESYKISYPQMKHLSMGMSNDYKIALKHGATLLRLGSILLK